MKRIILVLTVAAMMAAMTLGVAGSAMAQEDAAGLMDAMGFFEDPDNPGCWFAFDAMYLCTE